jgi:hypothetical protein
MVLREEFLPRDDHRLPLMQVMHANLDYTAIFNGRPSRASIRTSQSAKSL